MHEHVLDYVVVALVVALIVIAGLFTVDYLIDRAARRATQLTSPPTQEEIVAQPEQVAQPIPTDQPDRLLVAAPEVYVGDGWITLYEFARQRRGEARTYVQEMVADFYTACLTDYRVSDYFPGPERLGELRAHFANAFITLIRDGLHLSLANQVAGIHAGIRNPRGTPITGAVYDIVIDNLARTLIDPKYDVPKTAECLGRIVKMAELAKPLIAVDATPT